MLTGEYRHSLDDKGRVAVPFKHRTELAGTIYVSIWADQCLALHPMDAWNALADKTRRMPALGAEERFFLRGIFSKSFDVTVDKQGRVVIPESLRNEAGLEKEVVLIGTGDRVELWNPDRWKDYSAQIDDPSVLEERLRGLGI